MPWEAWVAIGISTATTVLAIIGTIRSYRYNKKFYHSLYFDEEKE